MPRVGGSPTVVVGGPDIDTTCVISNLSTNVERGRIGFKSVAGIKSLRVLIGGGSSARVQIRHTERLMVFLEGKKSNGID